MWTLSTNMAQRGAMAVCTICFWRTSQPLFSAERPSTFIKKTRRNEKRSWTTRSLSMWPTPNARRWNKGVDDSSTALLKSKDPWCKYDLKTAACKKKYESNCHIKLAQRMGRKLEGKLLVTRDSLSQVPMSTSFQIWLIYLLFTFFSFFILFWKTFDPMPCWNLYNWTERLLWRQIENSRVCVSHITLASLANFFRTVIENPSQVCTGRSLSVSFFNETEMCLGRSLSVSFFKEIQWRWPFQLKWNLILFSCHILIRHFTTFLLDPS